MLYIATVHYKNPDWIEIQSRHLRQHIHVPYQTWTSLQHIDPGYASHFDRVLEQRGTHAEKLNHLALEITHEAAAGDTLMFLDGDAFPIADPMGLIDEGLGRAPLLAVRRAENANEPQPHPCFCVTTVGTWRALPGDWSGGYTWTGPQGQLVSDVGGNLLRALELSRTPWTQVLRSNGTRLNPLFFAVYGQAIYHHGAGFRTSAVVSRADLEAMPERRPADRGPARRAPRAPRLPLLGRIDPRRRRREFRRRSEEREQIGAAQQRNLEQSRAVFEKIRTASADRPDWVGELGQDGT